MGGISHAISTIPILICLFREGAPGSVPSDQEVLYGCVSGPVHGPSYSDLAVLCACLTAGRCIMCGRTDQQILTHSPVCICFHILSLYSCIDLITTASVHKSWFSAIVYRRFHVYKFCRFNDSTLQDGRCKCFSVCIVVRYVIHV